MRRIPEWTLISSAGLFLGLSCGLVALSASVVPFVIAQLLQGVARAFHWTSTTAHLVRGRRALRRRSWPSSTSPQRSAR